MKLECDYAISFISQGVVQGVKIRGEKKQVGQNIKTWYLGRAYGVCRKIGNRWIENQQPIDLLDQPSNLDIGFCWYQNRNESMWTYDLTDHLMIELETIIALNTMTYIVETNLYESHPMNEQV